MLGYTCALLAASSYVTVEQRCRGNKTERIALVVAVEHRGLVDYGRGSED